VHAGSQQLLEGMVALNAMMLDTVAPDGTPEAVSQQQLVAASKALRCGVAAAHPSRHGILNVHPVTDVVSCSAEPSTTGERRRKHVKPGAYMHSLIMHTAVAPVARAVTPADQWLGTRG
jgi:hypothetical protein